MSKVNRSSARLVTEAEGGHPISNFHFSKFQAPSGRGWTLISVHAWASAALHAVVDNMAVVSSFARPQQTAKRHIRRIRRSRRLDVSTYNTSKAVIQKVSAAIQVQPRS